MDVVERDLSRLIDEIDRGNGKCALPRFESDPECFHQIQLAIRQQALIEVPIRSFNFIDASGLSGLIAKTRYPNFSSIGRIFCSSPNWRRQCGHQFPR
jgi:hypothetical protein